MRMFANKYIAESKGDGSQIVKIDLKTLNYAVKKYDYLLYDMMSYNMLLIMIFCQLSVQRDKVKSCKQDDCMCVSSNYAGLSAFA